MNCPVCNKTNVESDVCNQPLLVKKGTINTSICNCRSCGLYFRNINYDSEEIKTHFDVASYVVDEHETLLKKRREMFFDYLMKIIMSEGTGGKALLDIGCSYGHMMEIFQDKGKYDVYGLEINKVLRDQLTKRGFKVFESLKEIREMNYDVVTMIDSLYYFESPVEIIKDIRKHLKDDGLLLVRVINRAWLINLYVKLGMRIPYILMGDAKVAFTHKAMNELMRSNGFIIERVIVSEAGKIHSSFIKRVFYKLTELVSRVGFLVSPGLIYVVRKKKNYKI